MKEFKTEIIEKIVKESEGSRIVSLHDVGVALGHKHVSAQDCRDIISAALKRMPGYRVVKMVAPRTPDCCASLWETATFVDSSLEFEEGGEF